jgi:hypothetical protein
MITKTFTPQKGVKGFTIMKIRSGRGGAVQLERLGRTWSVASGARGAGLHKGLKSLDCPFQGRILHTDLHAEA